MMFSPQDIINHFTNIEIVTSELLFLTLTLSNVFVVYRFITDVWPFPVFVTWWQLLQGLGLSYILGEAGIEFSRLAYFPKVSVQLEKLRELLVSSVLYVLMLTLGNIVLSRIGAIATYPAVVSLGVIFHHLTRFLGCGEQYWQLRWKAIGVMAIGFFFACLDPRAVPMSLLPWCFGAGLVSSIFRAAFLEKLMHIVNGRGNILHNHQHALGALLLLPAIFVFGEGRAFARLAQMDYSSAYNWKVLGCLVVIGVLPFAKNVVANRLIRKTGQAPWRVLELISVLLILLIGCLYFSETPNWAGFIAVLLTFVGRALGAADVLINASRVEMTNQRNYATPQEESHEPRVSSPDKAEPLLDASHGDDPTTYQYGMDEA